MKGKEQRTEMVEMANEKKSDGLKITTLNGVERFVLPSNRGFSVYEELDGSLWLLDKTGYALRVGVSLQGEVQPKQQEGAKPSSSTTGCLKCATILAA